MFRGAARAWTPEDWNARLLALADARIAPGPTLLTFYDLVEPPREASPAQVRLALAYCDGALVLFTIRAFNFQVCRTWAGRDATGAVARVVTDPLPARGRRSGRRSASLVSG